MVDATFQCVGLERECINGRLDSFPIPFDPQSPRVTPAAEILRRVPAFRWIIPTEDFSIALGMRSSDTCILLCVPDLVLNLHCNLLGFIEVSEQHRQSPLPPLITDQVKALSFHSCQNSAHRVGTQGLHIEI